MSKIRIHAYISGRVQGVGYRYSTLSHARSLGLTGWVKNTHDGKVEAVFEGDEKTVEDMLSWCQQGPSMAYVTNIDVLKEVFTDEFINFSIK